jgi:serine/threonine-protein kinase
MPTKSCRRCGTEYPDDFEVCPRDGATLYSPDVLSRLGERFNEYEIRDVLGAGGMGVVYQARHVVLDKLVAIKIMHPVLACNKEAAEQFLLEARAASRIQHPNIVDVTNFGVGPASEPFFVMEYLEGESLASVIAREAPFDVFRAVGIINQVVQVLAVAHENGIVHRDIKPENILIVKRQGSRQVIDRVMTDDGPRFVMQPEGMLDFVKLLDFGVAKFAGRRPTSATVAGMLCGSPLYVSPEQAGSRPVDGRSDIYSLGVLFYQLVTGVLPVEGDTMLSILNAHVSGTVVPPQARAPELELDQVTNDTIMRCLEKDPDRRFQSMGELCQALQGCFTDRVFLRNADRLPGAVEAGFVPPVAPVGQAKPTTITPKSTTELHDADLELLLPRSRRPVWVALLALVVVGIGVVLIVARRSPSSTGATTHTARQVPDQQPAPVPKGDGSVLARPTVDRTARPVMRPTAEKPLAAEPAVEKSKRATKKRRGHKNEMDLTIDPFAQ